jgi:hypothetical protein
VTDNGVMALALGCKGIASTNPSDCSVTGTELVVLAQNCKGITDITLTGCDVTDVGIVALAVNCKDIITIYLSSQVSDTGVVVFAQNCKAITFIDLYQCGRVRDIGVMALAVGCKGITFICLHEAVLRVIVSPSWGPALCHHGRSGYQPFSLVPNPDGAQESKALFKLHAIPICLSPADTKETLARVELMLPSARPSSPTWKLPSL